MLKDLERAIDRLQTACDALEEAGTPESVALATRVRELRLAAQGLHEQVSK